MEMVSMKKENKDEEVKEEIVKDSNQIGEFLKLNKSRFENFKQKQQESQIIPEEAKP